jgi:hypothetical protein
MSFPAEQGLPGWTWTDVLGVQGLSEEAPTGIEPVYTALQAAA